MENSIYQRVGDEFQRIEAEYGVSALYACESGSRAWGFASTDSDYDVRFLYVHPRDWYFSIEDQRDVIEEMLPGDLDLSGWELRKALHLLRKSNPSLLEWIHSPLVYAENAEFIGEFRALATQCYSARRCFSHYFSMARGNYQTHLRGPEVKLKKYLYVLRPIFAAQWIERGLGQPPVELVKLLDTLAPSGELRMSLDELLERKRAGDELASAPPIAPLQRFIESELARLETVALPDEETYPVEILNKFFRRWVEQAFV
jgi:predicted nucleotidyltransferase